MKNSSTSTEGNQTLTLGERIRVKARTFVIYLVLAALLYFCPAQCTVDGYLEFPEKSTTLANTRVVGN
jgi:hypothetical protein